jgi:hypothetical protein
MKVPQIVRFAVRNDSIIASTCAVCLTQFETPFHYQIEKLHTTYVNTFE